MALIHQVASLFLPEKLAGRVAFSSELCEDMTGGAVGAGGTEPAVGAGVTVITGSGETSGVGDKGSVGWGFLGRQGQVAEVRMFSTGTLSLL